MAIKNIIFDLGGVVLNLDQEKTLRAFKRLGANLEELNLENSIFLDFETGKVDENYFLQSIFTLLKGNASKEQITQAWNSMLLELPAHRVEIIKQLKSKYRLFLLSNTNSIHINAVFEEHGKTVFEELFEKIYLSHEIGIRKPDVACYEYVLRDANLKGSETVFVDDNRLNLKGAESAGINTIWAKEPVDLWFIDTLKKTDVLKVN
jgi:HAD superfamily hydrolase (TIGR01509 family)